MRAAEGLVLRRPADRGRRRRRRPARRPGAPHPRPRRRRAAGQGRRPGVDVPRRARAPSPGRVRAGRTASRAAAVVACADFPAEERPLHEQEALVDMAGPGAGILARLCERRTSCSRSTPADGVGNEDFEAAVREAQAPCRPRSRRDDDRHASRLTSRRSSTSSAGRGGDGLPAVCAAAPALLAGPALRDLPLRRDARRLPALPAEPARAARRRAHLRRVPLGRAPEPDVPRSRRSALVRELLAADGESPPLRRARCVPRLQPEREGQGTRRDARREGRR